ncbi:dual specificity protein phosphatase 22-B-like [Galendromus occidentalis]|uniref:Dual specificity protein phosphatase 15 n=1 Tax=Galendromus occidentalis TaxID=34638 RepID=A0AAJ7PAA1_9ACAR|nr:dual specificity protein phosphatase 22-B-like [Galendromus occidentalis]
MGNGMNKVLPGLYVGNVRDSQDQVQLRANNITHIVAIHDTAREPAQAYLCLQAADSPSQNLCQFFPQSNDFIHTARTNGGNVLVHCLAGASRSVTIAVAYIMTVTSLNSKEALKAVRGARDVASPNDGFQKQLVEFESRKLNEERRRLRGKYPRSQFWDDEKECRKLLSTYQARELLIQAEGQRQASICRSGHHAVQGLSCEYRRTFDLPHLISGALKRKLKLAFVFILLEQDFGVPNRVIPEIICLYLQFETSKTPTHKMPLTGPLEAYLT